MQEINLEGSIKSFSKKAQKAGSTKKMGRPKGSTGKQVSYRTGLGLYKEQETALIEYKERTGLSTQDSIRRAILFAAKYDIDQV